MRQIYLPIGGSLTSAIGFGTSGLLRVGGRRARADLLAAARGCGITHFDTAPIYGLGESERALGRFLRGRRDRVTITTKFGLQVPRLTAYLAPAQRIARLAFEALPALKRAAAQGTQQMHRHPVFSVAGVKASLHRSLRALRTDYIDLYLAHEACAEAFPGEEVIRFLEDARRDGKIRAFGLASSFERTKELLSREGSSFGHVLQFDSNSVNKNVRAFSDRQGRLLITHGAVAGSIAYAKSLLGLPDEVVAGVLLRAASLANPDGIVLMQSRSIRRIEQNVRAAEEGAHDEVAA